VSAAVALALFRKRQTLPMLAGWESASGGRSSPRCRSRNVVPAIYGQIPGWWSREVKEGRAVMEGAGQRATTQGCAA
jgi:hypothetical protein